MRDEALPDTLLSRLSEFIAEKTGLHFPPARGPDLRRALMEAAAEFGFASPSSCADWLLSASATAQQLNTLAAHLTIGETYFFREPRAFDALAERVLPELIRRRRGHDQRLRLWSAACSTGEEPYSLAILLHQLLPDWQDWQVTILATDINTRFLQKAVAGVYGEWSFRESSPELKERYFRPTPDRRFEVVPEIREKVRFSQLNLAGAGFLSGATDIHTMDVILCRNLLIYFTPSHARKLVENLRHALLDEGWLVVSPSECSQTLFSGFATLNFPGTILYRKSDSVDPISAAGTSAAWTVAASAAVKESVAPAWVSFELPGPLAADVLSAESFQAPLEDNPPPRAEDPSTAADAPGPSVLSIRARALADQGNLTDALGWSERWVAADKLNASAHYLHAVILQERGERASARRSLQRAVYLQPSFVLAHFALGHCAPGGPQSPDAHKHFENALRLLRGRPADELVAESDGLTAGRLMEIIAALSANGPSSG